MLQWRTLLFLFFFLCFFHLNDEVESFPHEDGASGQPAYPNKPQNIDRASSRCHFHNHLLDDDLVNSSSSWYNRPDFPFKNETVEVLSIEKLEVLGSHISDQRISGVEIVDDSYYKLSNFCLRPFEFGGLTLFGSKDSWPELIVCAEVECLNFPFVAVADNPPSNAIWIDSASAVLPSFTGHNPWHTVHFLIVLTRLLHSAKALMLNSTVHLFPSHIPPRIRTRSHRKFYPFSDKYFSMWPILKATSPADISLFQVNLLEATFEYDSNGKAPTVCYSSGFLGGPRFKTSIVRSAPGKLFADIDEHFVELFRNNAIRLANAVGMDSGWCPGNSFDFQAKTNVTAYHSTQADDVNASRTAKPKLAIILRKKRVICNTPQLISQARGAGFDVKLLILERMTIFEQIRAVRQVDVIFGTHGAGLTHVLWAHKGVVLIEIYPSGSSLDVRTGLDINPNSNYGIWASSAGVSHMVWKDSMLTEYDALWRRRNVVVDAGAFRAMLSSALDLINKSKICVTDSK